MARDPKTEQLQIRLSPSQKRAIRKRAKAAHLSVSEWILSIAVPSAQTAFQSLLAELAAAEKPGFVFAELLELIDSLSAEEFELAAAEPPRVQLDAYWQNYLAATVERAAVLKHARCPSWTRDVPPLDEPVFGSSLGSLKLHLLVDSPPPFIQRNIFIDSNVGDRV